jgi:hypothetical protein
MAMSEDLISEEECWDPLAGASAARLALSVRALPVFLPVQYYLDERKLAVCLGHRQLPGPSLNAVITFVFDAVRALLRSVADAATSPAPRHSAKGIGPSLRLVPGAGDALGAGP